MNTRPDEIDARQCGIQPASRTSPLRGFGVEGAGFGVEGSGFWVHGLGFRE